MIEVVSQMIDEKGEWIDSVSKLFSDSNEYVVISIVGKQQCGKSTIASFLADSQWNGLETDSDSRFFPLSDRTNRDPLDNSIHELNCIGINVVISQDKKIILDVAPLLTFQNNIAKYNERFISWLMTISHIIVVVQDELEDTQLMRFISPLTKYQNSNIFSPSQNYPEIIFVYNQLSKEDLQRPNQEKAKQMIRNFLNNEARAFFIPKENHLQYLHSPSSDKKNLLCSHISDSTRSIISSHMKQITEREWIKLAHQGWRDRFEMT
eukprot:TRINITY_DN8246_c0_g2_i2.p1 TRINITY_DN8246_c0_g2~~TRINITY_DN8246_c0_g2_i2.p1  ORF type:complete len:265 (+),score=46.17 TRINITY_DN8246_c0_g2_i2:624-1418(+)